MTPFKGREVKHLWGGHIVSARLQAAQLVCFTGTLISSGQLVYYDLQVESSAWLFKTPLAGGRGTLWWLHCRPHSLFHWI